MADTQVVIYYGPATWFHEQIGTGRTKNLVTLMMKSDDERRQIRITNLPGEDPEAEPKQRRPHRVVVESGDFASLNEHVITNFGQHIRALRPKYLFINNPQSRVHDQLARAYVKSIRVEHYSYPTVTTETLIRFRDGFADHLVGQLAVRDTVMAAMYPLTRPDRNKPVVLMLYGPSGVGKTETAQFINGLLGGTLLRKQFSMFQSDKFASYLFGGSHAEASLAHDLLDRESGVILIDEFDKANPVFHSAFYELFDTGEFVDKNYTVKLGASLIICTSNYGSEEQIREALGDALASRFDALIEFETLTVPETVQVIERIVHGRMAQMSDHERSLINPADLISRLVPAASGTSNVRRLGKTIDTVISILLVRAVLDEATAPPRAHQLHPGTHDRAEGALSENPATGE